MTRHENIAFDHRSAIPFNTMEFFDHFIPIISEGVLKVLRLNLRLDELREKREQDVKYRKDQRVGEAHGG